MRNRVFTRILIVAAVVFVCGGGVWYWATHRHVEQLRTIEVNGVSLVYQRVGRLSGQPVVLLHGNGGSHEHLSVMAQQLDSAGYLVYAPDSRGQGANAPLDEYHYADMAEDVYAFCQALGIEKPAVFGWSDGGIIALLTEVLHPGTFSAIAVSGANITPDGIVGFEEMRRALTTDSLGNPMEPAPLHKMMLTEPHITPAELGTIACPTLVVAGEHDLILEEQTRLIARSIPHGSLLILRGEDHGSHIWQNPKMGRILLDYLGQVMGSQPYIAVGDEAALFDLVFVTCAANADSVWKPLTAMVTPYFGSVVMYMPTDTMVRHGNRTSMKAPTGRGAPGQLMVRPGDRTSMDAVEALCEMARARGSKYLTLLCTPEAQGICEAFAAELPALGSVEKAAPQLSMLLTVEDVAMWTEILPGYMEATETFYSEFEERVALLLEAPLDGKWVSSCKSQVSSGELPPMGLEIPDYTAYFRLDTLVQEGMSTWEKSLAIGRFVSAHIPHANQKTRPAAKDAITLWQYIQTQEPAFNCRYHSFFAMQLLHSVGVEARVLTCLPKDENDPDCHVVNIVYLPEYQKWAMLDTDQAVYATDAEGTPLAPWEMREYYAQGRTFTLWYTYESPDQGMDYYRSYMAKNTYSFASPTSIEDNENIYLMPVKD
ncbi:MAG: alpha/beta fold hydrolase [Paludibacteraceae bacterium]